MQTRLFVLVLGAVYVVVGIVGFVPTFYTSPPVGGPHLDVTIQYGNLFGLFPVNLLHDLFHIVIGLAGIFAAARLTAARYYSQTLFIVFGLLTVMGYIPTLNTVWGLLPLYGDDTWLHAATALAGAYFGYVATEPTYVEPAPVPAH